MGDSRTIILSCFLVCILLFQTTTFGNFNTYADGTAILPIRVASDKDVVFRTHSYPGSNMEKNIPAGETIEFVIFTYVDKESVSNTRLILSMKSLSQCGFERPDVFINGNFLGKILSGGTATTFEIVDKSLINWRTERIPWGENKIEIKIPKQGITDDHTEYVRWGEIRVEQRPIIFVPGIAGTELKNDGDSDGEDVIEWVDANQYLGDDDLDDLALNSDGTGPADPSWIIYPGKPLRSPGLKIPLFGFDYPVEIKQGDIYEGYLDFLKTKGYYSNYTIKEDGSIINNPMEVTKNPKHNIRLWELGYDWRLDNTLHVKTLSDTIDEITQSTDGWDKVILTAHSMGGLVTKKYIAESGGNKIQFLFTMGTPYYGAVKPYIFLKEGDNFGIATMEAETIRKLVQNWPSVYQLLPTQKYYDSVSEDPVFVKDLDTGGLGPDVNLSNMTMKQVFLEKYLTKPSNTGLMEQAIEFHESLGNFIYCIR